MAVQALARTAGLTDGDAFTLTYNGEPADTVFGVSLPATVASDDEIRAFITIDSPVEGQALTSPVTAKVSGNVFEGNVNWQLLDESAKKIDEGFVTTSMGTWTQVDVDFGALDPGTYTLRCLEYSAEDGHPMNLDDKTFTVE